MASCGCFFKFFTRGLRDRMILDDYYNYLRDIKASKNYVIEICYTIRNSVIKISAGGRNSTRLIGILLSIIINLLFSLYFTVVPSNTCVFLSCKPFVVNTTFSTGLVGVEVSSVYWLGQLTVGV